MTATSKISHVRKLAILRPTPDWEESDSEDDDTGIEPRYLNRRPMLQSSPKMLIDVAKAMPNVQTLRTSIDVSSVCLGMPKSVKVLYLDVIQSDIKENRIHTWMSEINRMPQLRALMMTFIDVEPTSTHGSRLFSELNGNSSITRLEFRTKGAKFCTGGTSERPREPAVIDVDLTTFASLPNLTHLSYTGKRYNFDAILTNNRLLCPKLTSLLLEGSLTITSKSANLTSMPDLRTLTCFRVENGKYMSDKLTHLSMRRWGDNGSQSIDRNSDIGALRRCVGLARLDIQRCMASDMDLTLILTGLKSLVDLRIMKGRRIRSLDFLVNSGVQSRLQLLILMNTWHIAFTDSNMRVITGMTHLKQLNLIGVIDPASADACNAALNVPGVIPSKDGNIIVAN